MLTTTLIYSGLKLRTTTKLNTHNNDKSAVEPLPLSAATQQSTVNNVKTTDLKSEKNTRSSPEELQTNSTALQLLNTVLSRYLEEPENSENILLFLKEIEYLLNANSSCVILVEDDVQSVNCLACTDAAKQEWFVSKLKLGEMTGIAKNTQNEYLFPPEFDDEHCWLTLLLCSRDLNYGVLLIQLPRHQHIQESQLSFLRQLSKGLTDILCSSRRAIMNRRQDVYNERAMIARELHDSLAQSLSYMKIQASRLQSLLLNDNSATQHPKQIALDAGVQELRSAINISYRQLRELMTTFRLTMNGKSLSQALEDSVTEFEKLCSVVFEIDNRLADNELSAGDELLVLQIVRESLSNIVRHASAQRARVSIRRDRDQENIKLAIEDDGIGYQPPDNLSQHHGMLIMQERAQNLGGDLRIKSGVKGGTRVEVSFSKTASEENA
ncbi:MAG: ATP-binding protein [Methyloligellaceae bacterium]